MTIIKSYVIYNASIAQSGITQAELDAALALKADLISRVQSVVSAATVTPNADTDDGVKITAQAEALILANPSGTPTEMQGIVIRIKDNGTARAITYGDKYRVIGTTLPTTTVINKTIYIAILYNLTDEEWDVIGVREEV